MTTPALTAVTFDYRLATAPTGTPNQSAIFLFEPKENAVSDWLNDGSRDFNRVLKTLSRNPQLESGTLSISWNDSKRAVLPIPPRGAAPEIETIGDLIQRIAEIMLSSDDANSMFSADNDMLQIAQLAGRLDAARRNVDAAGEPPAPQP